MTRIRGQIKVQPLNPALMLFHRMIDCGKRAEMRNGIDGGEGDRSDNVKQGIENWRNVIP